jgi:hypothetical protein
MTAKIADIAANTLLAVLGKRLRRLVLVAAIAGVAVEPLRDMAGGAGRIVIAVEAEPAAVVEPRRFPGGDIVALATAQAEHALMKAVRRRPVAGGALAGLGRRQQAVAEAGRPPRLGLVALAALARVDGLVERGERRLFG